MSLLSLVPLEVADHAELVAPVWVFPVIAAVAFAVLGLISWSYRDVFNRHRGKSNPAADTHGHSH